ncbi:Os02g0761150 [Oryza sativa Japonica Group]|uniref:Os02g0761150 protein n=1 Tax=Oryza sativa subsp. japonica TaxID=39947 RepID=A0A0N7KG50_ORYSJ|nr:hypothetical protein EE612_013823 [Oryza sativa]BAS81033.1 Os02g0761150 [Oryza sativa Japonica Group]
MSPSLKKFTTPSLAPSGSSPQSTITISVIGRSDSPTETCSIERTTPIPFITLPKTTCFPSRCGVRVVVMKN